MASRRPARLALSALSLAALLALTACGGDVSPAAGGTSAPAESSTPTPTVDTRPTPASSAGPARNVPKPVLPEAAKENTEAGFKAFTQYWFDTITYALETGDSAPLKAVSKPDCKICNAYAADALSTTAGGKWNIPIRWTVTSFESNLKLDPLGQAVGYFLVDESASTEFAADGSIVESRAANQDTSANAIYAVFDGAWTVTQAGAAG